MTDLKMIFLDYSGQNHFKLLNYIILVSKSYIYKEKLQKRIPSFSAAIPYFQMKYNSEFMIAKKTGKLRPFEFMWKPLKGAFNKER